MTTQIQEETIFPSSTLTIIWWSGSSTIRCQTFCKLELFSGMTVSCKERYKWSNSSRSFGLASLIIFSPTILEYFRLPSNSIACLALTFLAYSKLKSSPVSKVSERHFHLFLKSIIIYISKFRKIS